MKRVADGVHLLSGAALPCGFNAYLVDDVLVDAGMRSSARRILRELRGRPLAQVVLTHVHPDHGGGARVVCEALGVPLWCGAGDADAMEAGRPNYARVGAVQRVLTRAWQGTGHPVARRLGEGDRVGSFTVLETPGHTPGHVSLWREADRTLLAGEVLNSLNNLIPLGRFAPQEPARFSTADRRRNRASAARLAALEPALVCFCHGPPMRDTKRFVRYAAALAG
jgi:hydroxyacylglutathione hydrolase